MTAIKYVSVLPKDQNRTIVSYPINMDTYREICMGVFDKLKDQKNGYSKIVGDLEKKLYYGIKIDDINVYICVTSSTTSARIIEAFLDSIIKIFNDTKQISAKNLEEKMAYHNDLNNDKIFNLRKDIDEVVVIMMDNMDKVLERGAKIDELLSQSEQLAIQAETFKHRSTDLKKQMFCKHIKLIIIIFVAVCFAILIILMMACNINFSKCK